MGIESDLTRLIQELYPICRSITGNGVRETLGKMAKIVPLDVREVPSGTEVLDWKVPQEWNITSGYIEDSSGCRWARFDANNLHVVSYSMPVDKVIEYEELKEHVHTIPDMPDAIPYRTSYYHRDWGFCMSHNDFSRLAKGKYRVRIDSSLVEGSLSYGELLIPGETQDEVLIYSHTCHPSLCNDNLSGLAVSVYWARALLDGPGRRMTYRFVWGPGAIGSISWLAANRDTAARIKYGLVLVLVGRPGEFVYKRSRNGEYEIDRLLENLLTSAHPESEIRNFDPYGYDERQFCSPGFDLPVGRLTRAPHGEYKEYHTSLDNLDLVSANCLAESLNLCAKITDAIESNKTYRNQYPFGEPQLGKRGLYKKIGGDSLKERETAMLWLLNQSDGTKSILDISDKSGISITELAGIAKLLCDSGLLMEI